ncbi:MAG TPA: GNAT family protein [Chloroflexia bacterium]|nr:GNAT family protein [Chloroflexia bacterium]
MLKGEKINLRPVQREDLPFFEKWANDDSFNSEFNNFGLRRTDFFAKSFEENGYLSNQRGTLMVVTQNGEVVGDVSYHQEAYGPNEGSRVYNIGISLMAEHRGKGYGVEAQKLLAAYLFSTYPVMRVEASTDIENIPEQHALEKAGFTREGVLRKVQWRLGGWHDLVIYSKLRGE